MAKEYNKMVELSKEISFKNTSFLKESIQSSSFPKLFWDNFVNECVIEAYDKDTNKELSNICAIFEGLGSVTPDTGIGISLASQFGLSVPILEKYSSSYIKENILEDIKIGKEIIAFAITESHGGTNTSKNTTSIFFDEQEDSYVLNGSKWAITNMPIASYILTFAKLKETNSLVALLVDTSIDGVKIGKDINPQCMQTSPIGPVVFKNVKIEKKFILNDGMKGNEVLKEAFFRERLIMGFFTIGIMEFLISKMIVYINKRKIDEKKIMKNQFIQKRVTDSKIALEVSKSLTYSVLDKYIHNISVDVEASVTKIFVSNSLFDISENILRIYGINGLKKADVFSQLLIDSLALTIAGGTEEIHRKLIFQQTMRKYNFN